MNKEIKKQWIEALRSGKYKQGREYLCVDETYCCLGVLCDILKVPVKPETYGRRTVKYYKCLRRESREDLHRYTNSVLPEELSEQLKLSSVKVEIKGDKANYVYNHPSFSRNGLNRFAGGITLTMLNDNGFTFKEIADVIENCIDEDNTPFPCPQSECL